jgi:hypothetical protein
LIRSGGRGDCAASRAVVRRQKVAGHQGAGIDWRMGAHPLVSPLIEPERPEPDESSRLNIAPDSAVCDSVRDLLFDGFTSVHS